MARKRGTEEQLGGLHGALASYFEQLLMSGQEITPATLSVIRQFLKDNDINCVGSENPTMEAIALNLPVFKPEEDEMLSMGDHMLH